MVLTVPDISLTPFKLEFGEDEENKSSDSIAYYNNLL